MLQSVVLAELNPLKPVIAAPLFRFSIDGYEIVFSNHMLMVMVAAIILLIVIPLGAGKKRLVPKGLQNIIESICVFLRDEVAQPVLGHNTDRFIFFVWTLFFFILTMNLLGMVPTESAYYLVTGRNDRLGGGATANIWITGALAMVTFVLTHAVGIKEYGLFKYLSMLAPKVPWPILPLIYVLEILSALVRPFALAVRLFANMLAGHIVLATFVGLILVFKNWFIAAGSVGAIIVMSSLELLIAVIQAYIFTLLSALFINLALESEH
ncbi:MAG: F0F1 ATP synthase subunit A [Sedimentisphaerales bacterium]|jgi:F-type H+-transporting ATPase subunit a